MILQLVGLLLWGFDSHAGGALTTRSAAAVEAFGCFAWPALSPRNVKIEAADFHDFCTPDKLTGGLFCSIASNGAKGSAGSMCGSCTGQALAGARNSLLAKDAMRRERRELFATWTSS